MKQQLKLNESELHNLIEGAVKQLVMEYLPYEGGKVAARRLQQGDTSAFEKYMDYGINNGWTNDDMNDFQSGIETGPSVIENGNDYDEDFEDLNDSPINNAVDGSLEDDIAFEEGRRAVKVNESQLFDIIKESVNILLKEAFKSPKLAAFAKQHGGIKGGNKHGNPNFEASAWLDNDNLSLSELTDDMVGDDVVTGGRGYENNAVNFKDGSYLPIKNMQAARQMQQNWNANQDQRLRYNNGGLNYQKRLNPTFNRAMRQDLQTANRVKNDPNQSYSNQKRWADWERQARPAINKAYNRQGNLQQMMEQ